MIRLGDSDPTLLDAWMSKRHQRAESLAAIAPRPTPAPGPTPTPSGELGGAAGFAAALQGMRAA